MLCCKYTIPRMLEGGGGSIIFTSSIAGIAGEPVRGAYGASEHGVIGLMRRVASAYGRRGIRANAIAPGAVDNGGNRGSGAPMLELYERRTLVPRELRQDDVANLALFLASEESGFITGQVLAIEGGVMSAAPAI